MIKFNDNNIITGFIKNLLATFNLPIAKPYIEHDIYADKQLYIKDNYITQYNKDKDIFKIITPYVYNKFQPNYVKNLKINTQFYDTHTHEYLGEYLRFFRDFTGIDLMSMYNCFSNNLLADFKIELFTEDENSDAVEIESSNSYKIYAIPVKLNKKYTIAIASDCSYDLFCGIYDKTYISLSTKELEERTYEHIGGSYFNKPFIYDKLENLSINEADLAFVQQHEQNLKLFLKLPVENKSSIVILEGEYLNTNDKSISGISHTNWVNNHSIMNFEKLSREIKPISPLQLLYLNSGVSYPFADRLLEYLCDNTIGPTDSISDNIRRLQETLRARNAENKIGIKTYKNYGLWDDTYRLVCYNIAENAGLLNDKFDILGYVDKDIEYILLPNEVNIYEE